jgi:hypothetical protein
MSTDSLWTAVSFLLKDIRIATSTALGDRRNYNKGQLDIRPQKEYAR